MNDMTGMGDHGEQIDAVTEVDELISRLVDDAAGDDDRRRFDALAAGDPDLWRQLALSQRDMAGLRDAYEHEVEVALETGLPSRTPRADFSRSAAWLSFGGWAAAILIGLFWGTASIRSGILEGRVVDVDERRPVSATGLGPEQHFAEYLQAPYVLGQLQPSVMDVEEMPDGRLAVHFIRRVEEFALLNRGDLPVDEYGELTSDLTKLRATEPRVSMPTSQ